MASICRLLPVFMAALSVLLFVDALPVVTREYQGAKLLVSLMCPSLFDLQKLEIFLIFVLMKDEQ